MKKITLSVLLILSINCLAQSKIDKQTKLIVEEGKRLYKSEMASWNGTDIFLEKYKDREKIGGYFSYSENETSKCIFFSKEENPKVIGTITFDNSFEIRNAKTELDERQFTENEKDYYLLRITAKKIMEKDTIFKHYKNSNLNIIPLISEGEKKVYILCGPTNNGVVIFGNDYLLNFDNKFNLKKTKQLHRNIIPIEFKKDEKDSETIHNHQEETGDFITATDICTLMLYEKFAKWKNHIVVSKKYMSIWNCKTDELFVMKTEVAKKINDLKKDKKTETEKK